MPMLRRAVLVGSLLCSVGGVLAQSPSGSPPSIYSCLDAKGRRHTSDRPIPECQDREQRLLNSDASVRGVMPPAMSPTERAEKEARDQAAAQALARKQEVSRRERNLMLRYPNQASHDAARAVALDDVRQSIIVTQRRLASLAQERKPLDEEAQGLKAANKSLPLKLRQQINAIDAATQAQQDLVQTQQAELVRLTASYDAELAVLKRLWAGDAPGEAAAAAASATAATAPSKGR